MHALAVNDYLLTNNERENPMRKKYLVATAAFILGLGAFNGAAHAQDNAALDQSVTATLQQCQQISASCASSTENAAGILVFPNVVKADLIVGGAGGKGALIQHGKITGYYDIGAASAGLQAGIEGASQVYVFRTPEALARLKEGHDWKVGAAAGVTVVTADANAKAATGNVLVYVFDSKGLNAGVAVDVFDIWKAGQKRPS